MASPKRAIHVLLYVAFLCLLGEAAAFALSRVPSTRGSLFSGGAAFVEQIRGAEGLYRRFLAERYDGVLGWDNPRATTRETRACGGRIVTDTYLDDRSRRTPEVTGGPPILAFGDSFTLGTEVEDDDSYPAQLSRLLGRKVINQGVGGYDPLQAVLKFQQRAADYPAARTVVLGIMNEEVFRMLNSYRPAYFLHTGGMFGFKPYMRGAVQMANPNGPEPAAFDRFLVQARRAFRTDYWALPEPRFPYSLALLDSLTRPSVRLHLLKVVDLPRAFRLDDVRGALEAVLERLVASARAAKMAPVVLFIPSEPGYRRAFDELVRSLRASFGGRAVVTAVGDEAYRWEEYLPHLHCHPSVYGYRVIAEHAARAVREAETAARAPSTAVSRGPQPQGLLDSAPGTPPPHPSARFLTASPPLELDAGGRGMVRPPRSGGAPIEAQQATGKGPGVLAGVDDDLAVDEPASRATMRPPARATSASPPGAPVPSTTRPPRIRRSSTRFGLSPVGASRTPRPRSVSARWPAPRRRSGEFSRCPGVAGRSTLA